MLLFPHIRVLLHRRAIISKLDKDRSSRNRFRDTTEPFPTHVAVNLSSEFSQGRVRPRLFLFNSVLEKYRFWRLLRITPIAPTDPPSSREEFIRTCLSLPIITRHGWVRLFVGRRGVAKTYTGTKVILKWLARGEPCAVNWGVIAPPHTRHLLYRYHRPEELIGLQNCHVFTDESQADYNARDYINMTPEVQQWLRELRHWDLSLDLFVQIFHDLDKTFREQTDEVLWIHRLGTRLIHIPILSNIIIYWEHERIMHSLNEEAQWEPVSLLNWLMDALWIGEHIGYLDRSIFSKYDTKWKGMLYRTAVKSKDERRREAQHFLDIERRRAGI